MGAVDDYLAALPDEAARPELERLHGVVVEHVPGLGQGHQLRCRATPIGVPVAAVILRRNHIACIRTAEPSSPNSATKSPATAQPGHAAIHR